MTVYVDVVLLENIVINYIILLATNLICHKKVNFIRIIVSSFIGGVYSVFNIVFEFSILISIVSKIVISFFMIKIIYKNMRLKFLLKQLIFFYLVSLTFGGSAFMIIFMLNPNEVIFENGHIIGNNSVMLLVIGLVIGFSIISIVSNYFIKKLESQICELEIFYNGKNIKIKSFIDTGNLLKEPISMMDVIVVEKDSLKEILDYALLDNIDKILSGSMITNGLDFMKNKIKLIPFSSLGNEMGMLIGFKPDYVKIYDEDVKITQKVIVGIYDGKLNKSNLYTSLIGLNILKECDLNEQIITNT